MIPHARAAHAAMGADPEVEDAKRVLSWIRRAGRTVFSRRDAFEGTKGHFKKVETMEPALRVLEQHGFIRERPAADRPGPGRKPSPVYDVNPLWLSQNSRNSQNETPATDSGNSANSASPDPTDDPAHPDVSGKEGTEGVDGGPGGGSA